MLYRSVLYDTSLILLHPAAARAKSKIISFIFILKGHDQEKSLRHVAMVAKFLDDNKAIKLLKSLFALFQTSPILFNLI